MEPLGRRIIPLLLAAVALAFAPFAFADLFWDDLLVIRHDGPIASLATLGRVFTGRCVLFSEEYQYPYYRPLIDALFVIEYAFAGTRPFLYHLTNFLLHSANAALAVLLFRRVARGTLAAAAGAVLFALHPLQCESVLWPAARPAVLSLFFTQLGLLAAAGLVGSPCAHRRRVLFAASGLALVASLLAKETAIAVPPAATLLLLARDTPPPRRAMFLAALSAVLVVAYLAMNGAAGGGIRGAISRGPFELLGHMAKALGFYGGKLVWPLDLCPSYSLMIHDTAANLATGAILLAALAVGFAAGLWRRTRASLAAAAGLAIFGGAALLPMLAGQMVVADRYLYLGLWGLGGALAAVLTALPGRDPGKIVLAAAVFLAGLSLRQSVFWTRADILWARTLEVDPRSINAKLHLGSHFERGGDLARAAELYRSAAQTPQPAQTDVQGEAWLALATVQFYGNDPAGAVASARHALEYPSLRNRAAVRLAIFESARGDRDGALAALGQFADSGRESPGTYLNLARLALRIQSDREAARRWYARALERGLAADAAFEQELAAP